MSNNGGGVSAMSDEVRPSCWIRPSWRLTGVATMQPDCPPGWVDDAKPYYSKEALDAAVAVERERRARTPLTRQQIDAVMTEHYPLDSLLRENVDAFEVCVRDIERLLGIGPNSN